MPERQGILRVYANPRAAPAFASTEVPAEESIFARSVNLRPKANRSVSHLHVLLATLASVAAVAVLIVFCSRAYKSRAVHTLRSRRLASSEDSDASIDVCGSSDDEEDQEHHQGPDFPNLIPEGEHQLPLKKRLLAWAAEAETGAVGHDPQQQEEQQHRQEPAGAAVGLFPTEGAPNAEQPGPSLFPFQGELSSARLGTPAQLDAAMTLLSSRPHQQEVEHIASGTAKRVPLKVRQLQRQVRSVKKQLQREKRHHQQLKFQLQQQQREQVMYMQQSLDLYWQRQLWQQQQLQLPQLEGQPMQMPIPQQHYQHLHWQQQQQHLFHQHEWQFGAQQEQHQAVQPQGQIFRSQEQQQQQQPEQQMASQEGREQQHGKKQKHQGERDLQEDEGQQQPLQRSEPPSGYLPEDWIEGGFLSSDMPQPTTTQGALQFPAAGPGEGPFMYNDFSMQWTPRFPGVPAVTPSAAGFPGVLRNEAYAGPDVGGSGARIAASAANWGYAGTPSAAPTRGGGGRYLDVPALSTLLARPRGEDAQTNAAGEEAPAAGRASASRKGAASGNTGFPIPAYIWAPGTTKALRTANAAALGLREHPFVALPKRVDLGARDRISINFRRALCGAISQTGIVELLQKAHDLLSKESLLPTELKELAETAEELIQYAMRFHYQGQSRRQTYRAVLQLGTRFLLLDAVVSTLLILEQTPDPAVWESFTESVGDTAPKPDEKVNYTTRAKFSYSLAQDLNRAIQVLKKGRRPGPGELIRIKRLLFCSMYSPAHFKEKQYDRWRQDDRRNRD
ncbi:hypothetical protein EPH_0017450 [Eimeria praecox]|uniref:Uncharacterized protein n=1 Tax=Eimeria praecox TaxID=51316 RepID=U6H595_9EIME|nr:hypothetical protein EPH_0017450 [Eimeria praecox]